MRVRVAPCTAHACQSRPARAARNRRSDASALASRLPARQAAAQTDARGCCGSHAAARSHQRDGRGAMRRSVSRWLMNGVMPMPAARKISGRGPFNGGVKMPPGGSSSTSSPTARSCRAIRHEERRVATTRFAEEASLHRDRQRVRQITRPGQRIGTRLRRTGQRGHDVLAGQEVGQRRHHHAAAG